MKKIILGLAVFLALATLVWYARPEENKNEKTNAAVSVSSVFNAPETNYDFGSISMSAGKVKHMFRIENTKNEPLNIGKMYTSCMCTSASLLMDDKTFGPYGMPGHGFFGGAVNQVLNPNQSAEVEVIFDPAAHGPAGVGPIERAVFVESGDGSTIQLNIKAVVTP